MIAKQDILDRAAEWRLRPDVVEKDYVLGWLLAALATLPLRDLWIFKGGTSIKKCYFETYRFSEDLDFSLLPEAPYGTDAVAEALDRLAARAHELSGVQFPAEARVMNTRQNRSGQPTYEGRLGYRGPLEYPGFPKVRFDLTRHEPVLEAAQAKSILHPYPDPLPDDATVLAYSFPEVLAEKTRALVERSRPRDLYDTVHLIENAPYDVDLAGVRRLFRQKCASKGFEAPSAASLVAQVEADAELRSEWSNMLAHQLPALPDLDQMLARLPALVAWLDDAAAGVVREARLGALPVAATEEPISATGIRYWGGGSPLETVRFAGSNRLLLEFDYHGRHRIVEPYSVRRAVTTGNVLLYAFELAAGHVKAFKLDEMERVTASGQMFTARYQVEFAGSGPVVIGATAPARPTLYQRPSPAHTAKRAAAGDRAGSRPRPKYVYECPYCQRRFTHATRDASLRQHNYKDGWGACPGRRGHLVDTRW